MVRIGDVVCVGLGNLVLLKLLRLRMKVVSLGGGRTGVV